MFTANSFLNGIIETREVVLLTGYDKLAWGTRPIKSPVIASRSVHDNERTDVAIPYLVVLRECGLPESKDSCRRLSAKSGFRPTAAAVGLNRVVCPDNVWADSSK